MPDISNPTALYSPAVPGYPYYSTVNSATTDASNLIPAEKLSKKQRKKLAAEAALVSSFATSKSAPKEGKPSHQMDEVDDDTTIAQGKKSSKANNNLPIWGNEKTMNLNPLLLTNIQNSPYFKVSLYALKTYHEVIDEIWYQVKHLEPWEKGSRRVSRQNFIQSLSKRDEYNNSHSLLLSRSAVRLECAALSEESELAVLSPLLFVSYINFIPFV